MKAGADSSFRVTPRSVAIGLLYVVFLAALTPYNDYYIRNTFLAGNHFPIGSFFLFSVLVIGVNPLMRRVGLRKTLTPTELMVVWIMMLVGSGIPSSGYLRYHLFMLTAPKYFANSSNDWARLFHQYLPDWLVIKDAKAAQAFYEGLDPLAPVPWALWVKPALIWSGYALLTYFVMLRCLPGEEASAFYPPGPEPPPYRLAARTLRTSSNVVVPSSARVTPSDHRKRMPWRLAARVTSPPSAPVRMSSRISPVTSRSS